MGAANPQVWALADLFSDVALSDADAGKAVLGLALDSRQCQKGYVFFALAGDSTHGLRFLSAALAHGLVAVVVDDADIEVNEHIRDRIEASGAALIALPAAAKQVGVVAARFYGNDAGDFSVIGVTGTDGKTSVTSFIAQSLGECGVTAGLIGTVKWGVPGHYHMSDMTTPDPIQLQHYLFEIRSHGAGIVCMEVSSHALDQGRVAGVPFKVAVLTNLARDHLDYHGTVEAYAEAKAQLFSWPGLDAVVINADDDFGQKLLQKPTDGVNAVSYSVRSPSDCHAEAVSENAQGLAMQMSTPMGRIDVQSQLIGDFNAYNVLATVAVLQVLGLSKEDIFAAIRATKPVEGRMEKFTSRIGPTVVVDYAHTPQALEAALHTLAHSCAGRLWCVFGCGGERDRGKRAQMAIAAERYAVRVIVTDDNPRREPAEQIVADIVEGFSSRDFPTVIHDRREAIRAAITGAASEDWVLVAGKGHEVSQDTQGQRTPFSDRQVVTQVMEACA
jgi:UDP-N-acetylmuramoyl-L-alanyl-D-glutamate--2,6-diaminopimelate ligase